MTKYSLQDASLSPKSEDQSTAVDESNLITDKTAVSDIEITRDYLDLTGARRWVEDCLNTIPAIFTCILKFGHLISPFPMYADTYIENI